jgi:ABC-2 type transport system permease protein
VTPLGDIGLVSCREISERLRSRSFQATTLLLVIIGIGVGAGVGGAGAAGGTQRLAVVGAMPPGLAEAAAQMSAEPASTRIEVSAVADAAAGRAGVLAGRLDAVALDSSHVVVLHNTDGAKATLLARALRRAEIAQRLVGAGVEPTEAHRLVGSPTDQIHVAALRPVPSAAAAAALAVIATVCFVFGYGTWVAQGVVAEKTSGVSNIMLAMCPPTRFIVGKTLGVGTVAFIQAAVAALPSVVVLAARSHDVAIPPATLAGALMWFVLAFALYGHLIAAIAAWARRIDKMSGILVWITFPMVLMAFGGVLLAAYQPSSALAGVASFFPFSAPFTMPVRSAATHVAWWEVPLAAAGAALTAAGAAAVGARIYVRGLARA